VTDPPPSLASDPLSGTGAAHRNHGRRRDGWTWTIYMVLAVLAFVMALLLLGPPSPAPHIPPG